MSDDVTEPADQAEQAEKAEQANTAEEPEPALGEGGDNGEADGPDPDSEPDPDGDGAAPVSGLSWPRVAVLGAALTFLGFALAVFLTRDNPPGAGSVDVGFYQDMISHHDQALQMASLGVATAENASVRSFAADVLAFQEYETGVMERTLHEWGYSRADRSDTAMSWMGMPLPVAQMPGMATEAELLELQEATPVEANSLFLLLMADHHEGGLHMAESAAANADDHDVRELAQRMARNQAIEINEYAMLADRLGLDLDIEMVAVPPGPDTTQH